MILLKVIFWALGIATHFLPGKFLATFPTVITETLTVKTSLKNLHGSIPSVTSRPVFEPGCPLNCKL